jgi:hypothetical protein
MDLGEYSMKWIKVDDAEKWLDRLMAMATATVINWIHALVGFSPPGKTAPNPDDDTCARTLFHTVLETEMGKYPVFKFPEWDFADLDRLFDDKDDQLPIRTGLELEASKFSSEASFIKNSRPELYPSKLGQVLLSAHEKQQQVDGLSSRIAEQFDRSIGNQTAAEELRMKFASNPHAANVDVLGGRVAKSYIPAISPTEYAWLVGDTRARIELSMELARQEIAGWKALSYEIEGQVKEWEDMLAHLEDQVVQLELITGSVNQLTVGSDVLTAIMDRLHLVYDDQLKNQIMTRRLDRIMKKLAKGNRDIPPSSPNLMGSPGGIQQAYVLFIVYA